MIRFFEKIENLGVFANYKKPKEMEPFQRLNLIYGLNGSGKSTLSRFFADLGKGSAGGFPSLKYKITTEDGPFEQKKTYTRKVKVFNPDYVEANIGQLEDNEGKMKPIYVIGEESKTLAETLKADEKALVSLGKEKEKKEDDLEKLKESKGKFFTDVASRIINEGAVLGTYNKSHAEKDYKKLTPFKLLTIDELAITTQAIKQPVMDKQDELMVPKIRIGENDKSIFEALDLQRGGIERIFQKSSTSSAIERLKDNPELASWIEQGRTLHASKDDRKCEYCQQTIPEEREKELAAHFNQSDSNLKTEIEEAIAVIDKITNEINSRRELKATDFYPELREKFSQCFEVLNNEQKQVLSNLEVFKKALDDKLRRRTESYTEELPTCSISAWNEALTSLNALIQHHNKETDDFQKRRGRNLTKIKRHFFSAINENVNNISSKIDGLEIEIRDCVKGVPAKPSITGLENSIMENSAKVIDPRRLGITGLENSIRENREKISNLHLAADDLSQKLAGFLGRDDLKFEAEGEGYVIKRFGRKAQRLSEGEKTAITFLHFIVSLKDTDFNLAEGIVVIDDPISSLDSSSIYQAFASLKDAVKDAKQVFLLTHNFEFLKLLLDWFTYEKKKEKTYWMLHCSSPSPDTREAEIKPLDKTLIKNKNEFIYLFKILEDFESDGSIAQSYPIPNIVRKVLETFLVQHSEGRSFYDRLENLDYDDEVKKKALYNYTNDLSHPTSSGLDPALVGETQTNVKHLKEMIKKVAPVYYKALTKTIAASR